MPKYKIVYTDCIRDDADLEAARFAAEGWDFKVASGIDERTLIDECRDADGVIVSVIDMNARIIDAMERCRIIVRGGIGVNNVDIPAATHKGIMVANVMGYCLDEVADHALAMTLALERKVAYLDRLCRSGVWETKAARPVRRLSTLRFGLYGLGNISRNVARKAGALGFRVAAFDPFVPAEAFAAAGVDRIADEDEFFSTCDVISLHVPMSDATRGIVSEAKLRRMKPDALLINTARGGIVDEPGLIRVLSEHRIGGAGLDVLVDEHPDMSSPIFQLDNVLITPHTAFYSEESDRDLRELSCDQVIQALKYGAPTFFVNARELGRRRSG